MTVDAPLEELLEQYELYEPTLGQAIRSSPHLHTLSVGRVQLPAWEASSLMYLYGAANSAAFEALVRAMQLPETLETSLLRRDQHSRYDYYWNRDYTERVEHVRVDGPEIELAYANRRGHFRLRITAPPLEAAQNAAALEWLALPATLNGLARGEPLAPHALTTLGLAPAWRSCIVAATSKSREALETGLQFVSRALVVHPEYLLILRGLGGEAAIRRCVTEGLARRRVDFEAAAAALPASPEAFWEARPLPAVPAPHEVAPLPGLGQHLPPPGFWSRPEDNAALTDTLTKVYRSIPRKLARLTEPRHY